MAKIGQFIYPWGNGHYSRMIRLNEKLKEIGDNEFHYFSKGDIYEKLLEKFPNCLLYTSPSPRDQRGSRMPSSA